MALLGALLMVAAGCGTGPQDVGESPGFGGEAAPLDTTPFLLPEGSSGSTTLPSGYFGDDDGPPVAPTTAQPPLSIPEASTVSSICGFTRSATSLFRPGPMSSEEIVIILDEFTPALDRFVESVEGAVRDDLVLIATTLGVLEGLFREGGDDLEYPPLVTALDSLATNVPPYDQLTSAVGRVAAAEVALGC